MHNPCTKIEKNGNYGDNKNIKQFFYFSENSKGTTRQQNT